MERERMQMQKVETKKDEDTSSAEKNADTSEEESAELAKPADPNDHSGHTAEQEGDPKHFIPDELNPAAAKTAAQVESSEKPKEAEEEEKPADNQQEEKKSEE